MSRWADDRHMPLFETSAKDDSRSDHVEGIFLTLAHKVTPNFQVFWLADAVNQGHPIPAQYVLVTVGYGALLIGAALCVAIMLFQRREVG